MSGKRAGITLGLAFVAGLGFAMAHAHLLKSNVPSSGLSAPCEPAPPVFEAAIALKTVSTLDSADAAEGTRAVSGVMRKSRVATDERKVLPYSLAVCLPLFDRPPPADS
jgi:hypothetical protein